MPDNRWRQVEELFFAAVELPEPARAEFLDRACRGDQELRRETESLLATDLMESDSIATLIESAATSLFDDDSMEGARLGPWRIDREIGRGGMGAVYLAARADQQFVKRVAIKLVKRGIDTDAVLKRFRQERQILAGLDHPNIARLIDAGTSIDGRPYFVMEYVEGTPIHIFCQQKKLSLVARCELFRQVCAPVSYAHRHLVIHRDLKPANILVTADGSPKLLDFGIARLLNIEAGENTVDLTGARSTIALTPAYASPEQSRGEAINTATDVYSLGAILLQILTGETPRRRADGELDRKPLSGDLDRIVLMATHTDPARRYQSVDQLSEDLRRYIAGLPVLAQEDTWTYRVRKFALRNRVGVLAGGLIACILIGGIVAVLWEARQTRIQRQRAEQRLGDLVEMANRTLFRVDGSIERLPGATQARRDMVRSTLDYLDRLNTENGNDARVLSAMAFAYTRLARIEGDPLQPNLGDLPGAEASYRKAEKILEGLIAASPANLNARLQLAECSKGLAEVLGASGQKESNIAEARKGLVQTAWILNNDPHNLAARKSAALLHLTAVAADTTMNHLAEARQEILQELPRTMQMVAEYPHDEDCILILASTWSQFGTIASREGDIQQSLSDYQKSVALREQLFALHPNDVAVQRDLMIAYGHVGDAMGSPFLMSAGDPHGALVWYRKAAQIAETMVASDPSDTQARIDLAVVLMRTGTVLQGPGEVEESLAVLDRSASIFDSLSAADPKNVSLAAQWTLVYEYQAQRLLALHKPEEARRSYQRSLDICAAVLKRSSLPSCARQIAIDEAGIAATDARLGERAEAIRLAASALGRAQAISSAGAGLTKIYFPRALGWNGEIFLLLAGQPGTPKDQQIADWREAAGFYRKALAEWGKLSPSLATSYTAEAARMRQRLAECESHLQPARPE
ncbi:MAG TPA: serine/threonine-protein kinase [Bryobacteraceae bacterium]|nr:serine/threonine-protein kinase [Bryobacteraceae bacterium]